MDTDIELFESMVTTNVAQWYKIVADILEGGYQESAKNALALTILAVNLELHTDFTVDDLLSYYKRRTK